MKKVYFHNKYFLIVVLILIISSFSINTIAFRVNKWNIVKERESIKSAFVFDLYMHSWFETEHLEENEFLLGDVIDFCYVYILEKKPIDLEIIAERIRFTSPSKKIYEINLTGEDDYFQVGKLTKAKEDAIIILNESGLWSINIIFDNEKPLSLISTVPFEIFFNTSEINIFYGSNINVYTNLEYQQLRASKALEESAKSAEEDTFWSMASAIAAFILAVGTFCMVYFTYISYKSLSKIQKTSLEPVLAVNLWKQLWSGDEELSWYGVTIKNNGLGPAKNVKLWIDWALAPPVKKPGEWAKHDFNSEHFYGAAIVDIGTIGAKEKKDLSTLPLPGDLKVKDVYGVKLIVTCEDIFEKREERYSDSKNEYLSNAEIKKIEF